MEELACKNKFTEKLHLQTELIFEGSESKDKDNDTLVI